MTVNTRRSDPRPRVLELLRRYGWNATSFQLLDPDFDYWFGGEDACVAYVDTGAARVVGGSPIAPMEKLGEVTAAFIRDARRSGRRVAFFAVERRFLHAIGLPSLQIGEQAWWDPGAWKPRRSLREQVRRARAKGVTIERVAAGELEESGAFCAEAGVLISRWLASRPMAPMAFLVDLNPFRFASERRFYAAWERAGERRRLVAFLVAAPVFLREGWFIEDIVRDPAAPNGVTEALVDAVMREVREEGCTFVTLGLAPLSGQALWMRLMRRGMSGFYNFEGLRAFKAKLAPEEWDPIYLAFARGEPAFLAIYDVLSAFAKGKVIGFATRSLLRAPAPVLRVLATLLVPWIVLLASPLAARWFPSSHVQYAWAAFDVLVAAGFFVLARRWRRGLARILLGAVGLDVVLTIVQVVAFNLRRMRGPLDVAVCTASVAAPMLAAAILAGGLRRRESSQRGRGGPKPAA